MNLDETIKESQPSSEPLTVYGRPGCPGLGPVRRLLDTAGVAYEYVDIRQDPEAAARLRAITGGYESVPTVVLPNGRTLVEPGTLALRKALQADGLIEEETISPVTAARAGLSNPVYLILALIALATVVVTAIMLSM